LNEEPSIHLFCCG